MDLVLISLISKLIMPSLLGGLLLLTSACSSKIIKSKDEEDIKLNEELESLSRKVMKINMGPTVSDGATFQDKTKEYGLADNQAVAFNAVDLNFAGKTDLVLLPSYYSRPKFFLKSISEKKFIPLSYDPLPPDFKASFLVFHDMNKDQIPDLISVVLNQKSEISKIPIKIYLGSMKEKRLVFIESNLLQLSAEPTSSVSVIDVNLDGWPDLFIGNWYESRNGEYIPVADRLFLNKKDRFEEASFLLKGEADKNADQLFPPNARPTYGSSTCDIDQNGFPDILTASSSGHKNKLWMNLSEPQTGERYFEDVGPISNYASDPNGSLIPTGGGRSFFSACNDYNHDGLMDIFLGELSHAYDNESVDRSSVLTGSKETYPPFFIRTEYLSDATNESWNQGDRRAVWLDYNLDGRDDLLVDNSGFPPNSRLVLFEQDETHAFINVASQLGLDVVNPMATITIDVNEDGLPDILTSQNNIRRSEIPQRLYLFENNHPVPERRSIRVFLNGIKANTQGMGAMVMLYIGKNKQKIVLRKWNELSQGGLASQNQDGVHFGISEDTLLAGIKVRWPILKNGKPLEKLYSLKGLPKQKNLEVTVCEDGKLLIGRVSCHL